ncbi:hypothetical protein G7Z17_g377 [Cylindrodendrum hubeiense]|uniref:Zn(2)-C6 fungal-type domain-containing protein n=1 Tax=Cylindrodendrum hubeiense TaxID=595255 RepID=A0A9P5LN82_9HYPO|nr:hypothetical protein G7Z17_g377 [Cylindrodendrum hubeiense]
MSAPTGTLPRSSSTSTQGRRQACDRCSEQKVRCIRSAPTNDDVGIGEAGALARCIRCSKARASCVYSLYQRSGRPAKRSPSSELQWENHSKRATRPSTPTSIEKGAASSSIEAVSATMPGSSKPRQGLRVEIPIDPIIYDGAPVELGPPQHQTVPAATSELEPDAKYETSYEQCIAEFSLNGLEIWSSMPTLSPGSISPQAELGPMQSTPGATDGWVTTSDPPDYDDSRRAETNATAAAIATANAMASRSIAALPNTTEVYIEQLAELNLAIFRVTRSICGTADASAPASLAWSVSGEIFEAASSLIKLIDAFSRAHTAVDTKAAFAPMSDPMVLDVEASLHLEPAPDDLNGEFGANAVPPTIKSDPGVALLILAAHQRLLSAFENMCASIHRYLQVIQEGLTLPFDFGGQQQAYSLYNDGQMLVLPYSSAGTDGAASLNTFGGQTFAPSSTAQFVVITELITYYLNRLDRALGPAMARGPEQGPDFDALLVQSADVSDMSSGSSGESSPDICSLGFAETSSSSSSNQAQSSKGGEERPNSRSSSSARALTRVGHDMHERYQRLREHIKLIKRVIRASNDS